jgi:phage tail sheath protein FI
LRHVLDLLGNRRGAADRRDVMLLASLPLPAAQPDLPAGGEAWPLAILDEAGLAGPGLRLRDGAALGSARLHLGYPWVATAASAAMPEGVEGPEGALAGVLARSALRAGAFRAAAGSLVPGIRGTLPALGSGALRRGVPGAADWLGDRLCLVGARHDGFALLSDATMAEDRAWRAGGVSRLMAILLRAARSLGQERVFDNSGPALWSAFAEDLTGFLRRLHAAGAFAGATEAEAFTVRCDRSTMAQADIDAARCIATVAFTVAQPLQRITVTLALGAGVPAATAEAA